MFRQGDIVRIITLEEFNKLSPKDFPEWIDYDLEKNQLEKFWLGQSPSDREEVCIVKFQYTTPGGTPFDLYELAENKGRWLGILLRKVPTKIKFNTDG